MLNERLLNGEMAKAGLSGAALAEKIGITPKTFYTKKKKGSFRSDEISIIIRECEIKDPMPIFFPEFVTQKETK